MAKKKSKIEKASRDIVKNNKTRIIAIILCLIIGIIVGVAGGYYITKNDTFEIIGDKEIFLKVGNTYNEEGARVIAFGKDVSKDVTIEGEVDTLTPGVYMIKYTTTNFKYKKIVRVRYVEVLEVEDED